MQQCDGEVKTAIVVARCQVSPEQARQQLAQAQGHLRQALERRRLARHDMIRVVTTGTKHHETAHDRTAADHWPESTNGAPRTYVRENPMPSDTSLAAARYRRRRYADHGRAGVHQADASPARSVAARAARRIRVPLGWETAQQNHRRRGRAPRLRQPGVRTARGGARAWPWLEPATQSCAMQLDQWCAHQELALRVVVSSTTQRSSSARALPQGPGIALIAGTGSLAYGQTAGRVARRAPAGGVTCWATKAAATPSAWPPCAAIAHATDGRGPDTRLVPRLLAPARSAQSLGSDPRAVRGSCGPTPDRGPRPAGAGGGRGRGHGGAAHPGPARLGI